MTNFKLSDEMEKCIVYHITSMGLRKNWSP